MTTCNYNNFDSKIYTVSNKYLETSNLLKDNSILKFENPVNYEGFQIPCVCHQTWKSKKLSPEIEKIRTKNKKLNNLMKFKLYNDSDIDKYIKTYFKTFVYDSFCAINSSYGAAKADFFRYCVLYREGGVYLDIKSSLTTNLFTKIIEKSDIAILDTARQNYEKFRINNGISTWEQWVLIFAPRHEYMRRAVERICKEIYSHCRDLSKVSFSRAVFPDRSPETSRGKEITLRLTGPDGLAISIHESIIAYGRLHRSVDIKHYARLQTIDRSRIYEKNTHYSDQYKPIIDCNFHIDETDEATYSLRQLRLLPSFGKNLSKNYSHHPQLRMYQKILGWVGISLPVLLFLPTAFFSKPHITILVLVFLWILLLIILIDTVMNS